MNYYYGFMSALNKSYLFNLMDNVIVNKVSIIERCLKRIHEEYQGDAAELKRNFTKQDSVILNLQRLCEASIDIANRCLKLTNGPIPQSSRDSFSQLERMGLLNADLAISMQKMVGLRNIAVHDYLNLNLDIVIAVLDTHLRDFQQFAVVIMSQDLDK